MLAELLVVLTIAAHPGSPAPAPSNQGPVTVSLSGSTITSVSAGGLTLPAAQLTTGVSNANTTLYGNGGDADDLDLSSYFAKNGHSLHWDADFGAWTDPNGAAADFFLFEAGGNDSVQVAAWLLDGSFGQPVAVGGWSGTGFVLSAGPNSGQTVHGVAISFSDLLDQQGQPLPVGTSIRGLRVLSDTIDGCALVAVASAAGGNLPPLADAGPDQVVALPATSATLDGSASADPEDPSHALIYSWTQVSGPAPAVMAGEATPTLSLAGLVEGNYVFQLSVTDTAGATSLDLASVFVVPASGPFTLSGELKKWHRLTLTFPNGPVSSETSTPNPFLDYRLDVSFVHSATGKSVVVPGFFAADGHAQLTHATSGAVWRAHFLPEEAGIWTWSASFVTGAGVAVDDTAPSSPVLPVHGAAGIFTVAGTDKSAPDNRARGLLRYRNQHHLVFAETGERFLKGGADSPENMLGYFGFDGTYDNGGLSTPGLIDGLHRFAPHAGDWAPGDPEWTDAEGDSGRNLIGALNYAASRGVNSVYFLTYNIDGGDGRDTWPWISTYPNEPTAGQMTRFDCSKLAQWEIMFSHMDRLGMQLHVVTQEIENNNHLDGGNLNTIRRLYYRELVARFSHHPALIWNIGEENSNSNSARMAFAQAIRDLDPYDHPITIHTNYNTINPNTGEGVPYTALYGHPAYEATSLQGDGIHYNDWARVIRERSALAGRPWAVFGDEQGPAVSSTLSNLDALRRDSLWGNLIGGGAGVEWYFGYQGTFGDVQSEDWRVTEQLWDQTTLARRFFAEHTRFWEMEGRNDLAGGGALCLAKPGEQYVIYSTNPASQAPTLDLEASTDTYRVRWFNPRSGGGPSSLLAGSVSTVAGPGMVSLGLPPTEVGEDWAVLITNENLSYYGRGVVSSKDMVPALSSIGSPSLPNPAWGLEVSDVPAGQEVFVLAALNPSSIPVGAGHLLVFPPVLAPPFLTSVTADVEGRATLTFPLGNEPALAGLNIYIQALLLDADTDGGVALSEGLRVTLH